MNQSGDYKRIKNLHTCFEVRVKCIHLVLNLQIQFQALHCFYFLLINQNQWHTRVVTQVLSLNSFDLFLVILVTHKKQLDYCKIVQENFTFVL